MILADSSVWIDYFNGQATPETEQLDALLWVTLLGIGDLILAEVLQGFRTDADYETARYLLLSLPVFEMLGVASALRSAEAYRTLRKKGVTIRKTTDVIVATFCITEGHALLFSYRDFLPFVQHLGLQPVVGSP
jgi:hypothetical protein